MILKLIHKTLGKYVDPMPQMLSKKPVVQLAENSKQLLDQEAVFVISPGRSGTMNLTTFVSRYTSLFALHSAPPSLSTISSWYFDKLIPESAVKPAFYVAREHCLKAAYERNMVFFDGDCKSLPLTIPIGNLMPNAKFIHLVRKPEDFICSGICRGYFTTRSPELWGHLNIITDKYGQHPSNHIEKIAAFWEQANLIAESAKKELGTDRGIHFHAEDMFASTQATLNAFHMLNLDRHISDYNSSVIKKINTQKNRSALLDINQEDIHRAVHKFCKTKDSYYA